MKFDVKKFAKYSAVVASLCTVIVLLFLIFSIISPAPKVALAQGPGSFNQSSASILPTYFIGSKTFTATSQSAVFSARGVSGAFVEITGAATAATITITGSNDGGVTYFPLPSSTGVYTSNVLTVTTGAALATYTGTAVNYWMNFTALTNIKVATSGTFTGTSATVYITASPNKGLF